MTHFRFIPLAVVLTAASALVACSTAPAMPMGSVASSSMATPDSMGRMDAQMKTMRDMHEKMMNAKTPQERSKLMAGMSSGGMGDMKDMKGIQGMTDDMGGRQQMMEKRMEMMQMMMMDQMPTAPAK